MAFSDVNADLITYLKSETSIVTIVSDIPNPRPVEFAMVRRLGGLAEFPVTEVARFDIYTWASTTPRAMELLLDVRAAVWRLGGKTTLGYPVYLVVEFMGPTLTADPQTGTPQGWYRPEITVRANDVVQHSA